MANFDFLKSIGATPEAVAVLNDQPNLFVSLIAVIVALMVEVGLLWGIHFATLKPEQKKKKKKESAKKPKDNARGGPSKK